MQLTLTNLSILVSIAGTVFAVMSGLMRFFLEYLTSRFGKAEMTVAEQSAQCRFDHETIGEKLRVQGAEMTAQIKAQNEYIATLLRQNGEQLKYMSDASHNAELRHQIIISKLEKLEGKLG
jgi:hypothetical protein